MKKSTKQFRQAIEQENPKALFAQGLDDAIIGIGKRCGKPSIVVYSTPKCIKILQKKLKCSYDEAFEYFEYNVAEAWYGNQTPIFVDIIRTYSD